MNKYSAFTIVLSALCFSSFAQENWSEKMAQSIMTIHKDSIVVKENKPANWDYEQGLFLKALEKVWRSTANPKYYNYIQKDIDRFVDNKGNIKSYPLEDYNLDNINTGRILLTLYQQSLPNKEKYRIAADQLYSQIENQPLTNEGGFWHKKRYPYQMWLDGLFMAEPFSAEYSKIFNHPEHFDIIAKQFELIEKHVVDPQTGLIYHGNDESKEQQWADKATGLSPHFWGRAIGWYAMALVDVLDYFPENHPKRSDLIKYLQRLAPVLTKYQDTNSGVWYQMIALGTKNGNYLESSSSCMFTYALLKGVRKGYLDSIFKSNGIKGFQGILKEFISTNPDGTINLENTVSVGGLGGNPYRDGTYEYYLSEPIKQNDLKGVSPFIFAAIEMELLKDSEIGKGKKVGLDYYFNKEFRTGYNGQKEQYHYTWEDQQHSGFSWFGDILTNMGAEIVSIKKKPSKLILKDLHTYIIVDPDDEKETENPNLISTSDNKIIRKWVKKGGTLIVLTNDAEHCNLNQIEQLIKEYNISFTDKNINMVTGSNFEMGSVKILIENNIFRNTKEVYIKEQVTLKTDHASETILRKEDDVIMATSTFKKGKVIVLGDPWLYNEYIDGRKLPMIYQNFQAAKDFSKWILTK
jgi:unsaturated rhamnogalacturonyl hydrolase